MELCPGCNERPSRPTYRFGLCKTCTIRAWRNGGRPTIAKKYGLAPTCGHPTEPLQGKGMCAACYSKYYRTRKRGKPPAPYAQSPTCHPDRKHHAYGLCKPCFITSEHHRAPNRAYMKKNHRIITLKKYNLTPDEYDTILKKQNGVCAICQTDRPTKRSHSLPVDHDHVTGKVRGILCIPCNRALGYFENTAWRARAEAYLYQPRV